MANRNVIILILIGIVVALFYISPVGNGASPSGAGDFGDSKLQVYLADENYNPVEPMEFSTVTLPGTAETSGVYFMRFNVLVTNQGNIAKDVRIIDVTFYDADGNPVEQSTVDNGFSCIRNSEQTIAGGADYTWNTDPTDPTTGCSSLVWLPTTVFEDEVQPLTAKITVNVKFTLFGITRESTYVIPGQIAVAPDAGGLGAVTGELSSGVSEFLSECTAGETLDCPYSDVVGSVCEGIFQTCYIVSGEDGLWPGCSLDTYGPNFVPNKESNSADFKVTCKDGYDNDCDGVTDKPLVDGTCPSGTCDYDCPACIVTFRTNALVDDFGACTLGGECPNHPYIAGTWIAIDTGDSFLKSYGYGSIGLKSAGGSLRGYLDGTYSNAGYTFYGNTPKQNLGIWVYTTDARYVEIFYDDDSDPNNIMYLKYYEGNGCQPIIDPECVLTKTPVDFFTLVNQESCVDY